MRTSWSEGRRKRVQFLREHTELWIKPPAEIIEVMRRVGLVAKSTYAKDVRVDRLILEAQKPDRPVNRKIESRKLEEFLAQYVPHGGQQMQPDHWSLLRGPLVRTSTHDTPLHKPGVDESCLRCQFETEFKLTRTKSPVEQG